VADVDSDITRGTLGDVDPRNDAGPGFRKRVNDGQQDSLAHFVRDCLELHNYTQDDLVGPIGLNRHPARRSLLGEGSRALRGVLGRENQLSEGLRVRVGVF
jgi:hypothetical protein